MLAAARRRLLAERVAEGHWVGELSSSALSTATAAFALHLFGRNEHGRGRGGECERLAGAGVAWLAANQNGDGGWGDTTRSLSNISTTALCWAAIRAVPAGEAGAAERAEAWLRNAAGSLEPSVLSHSISSRYGKDHTFSVPILTMCTAAGVLGDDGWRHVPQLPFELAAMPRSWFAFLRLPVVSYALPALIAIGHVRHRLAPSRNLLARLARQLTARRTLQVLEQIQPRGGGFLEATPLTSFVVMSLVAAGKGGEAVVSRGVDFLVRSARADGSWAIDTNLSTWVTTLSVNALAASGRLEESLSVDDRAAITYWLLAQQYREPHPYTGAAPGGWAWTNLPGGVPDADDTAGALLALRHLAGPQPTAEVEAAARAGVRWLLGVQNRDGGIPTFCRGWGTLPFDRSAPELTAHSLQAWGAWFEHSGRLAGAVAAATRRATDYLRATQARDGSWTPLWFGNQAAPGDANPTHGTSRVLAGLMGSKRAGSSAGSVTEMVWRGATWLLVAQNPDGGWGGAPGVSASVEETCQAITALAATARWLTSSSMSIECSRHTNSDVRAVERGMAWLVQDCGERGDPRPAPLVLYFAKLWYWERLYPLIGLASLSTQKPPGVAEVLPNQPGGQDNS